MTAILATIEKKLSPVRHKAELLLLSFVLALGFGGVCEANIYPIDVGLATVLSARHKNVTSITY